MNSIIIHTKVKSQHLSNKKARIFSLSIAPDIGNYIKAHRSEYEAWLTANQKEDDKIKRNGVKI